MAVFYEKEGKIVTMRLDLTEMLNRVDAQTFQTLSSSLMDFRDDPEAWAAKIYENGPLGLRRAKEAIIRGRDMALEDGLRLELTFFEEVLQSEDYQEGLRALTEERKPEYKGR